ncbi:MAG: DUF4091 domain-containing protein [Mariniblastus sp.]|nr:DUF4091 domain-containing protein [Mariniblastus sp.]
MGQAVVVTRFAWAWAVLFLALVGPLRGAEEITVWATGSTEKIRDQQRSALPHDHVWDAPSRTVHLQGVRGEHLPFQVVVSTERRQLKNVKIEVGPLVSGQAEIEPEQVELFLMPLVNVYAATQDHGQTGRWPDPMVPLVEPFDMRFYWYSQKINHQSVWVDIEIPGNQSPGTYRGKIGVAADGVEPVSLHIEVLVHDLQLPEQRDFPVHIGLYENHIARVHAVDPGGPEFRALFDRYLDELFDHQCDPRTSPGFRGEMQNGKYRVKAERPDLERRFLEQGRLQFWISPVPGAVKRPSQLPFPNDYQEIVRQHVRQVIEHARQAGWYEKLGFHLPVDEPNSAEDYGAVRHWAELIKSVDPAIPVAVTEQPKPENSDWGSLQKNVDAWIINGNYLASDRESIEQARQRGDQRFWYISCDQLYPQPNLYIDREAADPRIIPWVAWQHQMTGFLYWNGTYWGEVINPWRDPVTWKTLPCNLPAAGEGSLFYPGHLVRNFAGQPNVEGPVGSLRLKLLREGLEERALLQMLSEKIGRAAVQQLIAPVCTDIRTFSRNPNELDQVRQRVIERLLQENKGNTAEEPPAR